MAIDDTSPEQLRKFVHWLDEPLTAGKEQELNEWLANEPDHQMSWDRWTNFNVSAKLLQIVPSEVGPEWAALRDELGFQHSSKKSARKRSRSKKRSLLRTPIVIATLATITFALFLSILYLIRLNSAF